MGEDGNLRKISIDLNTLKIPSGNNTRKKRDPVEKKFKIKTPPKPKNKSIKRNLLKFIRNQQAMKLKNEQVSETPTDDFNSSFSESVAFLNEVSKKTETDAKVKNRTLKHYEQATVPIMLTGLSIEPVTSLPISGGSPPVRVNIPPPPAYGCLKGGKLPLYRQYTQKNREPIGTTTGGTSSISTVGTSSISTVGTSSISTGGTSSISTVGTSSTVGTNVDSETNIGGTKLDHIAKMTNFMKSRYKPPPIRRQRKTVRRTYNVGKSATVPRVSVLISNKTIRNNISTRSQLLKQTPIQEVRKYLVKNGFIKVGSIAPNDVLRKMYETASLVCGEIHNYNPENLVYNFFNEDKA